MSLRRAVLVALPPLLGFLLVGVVRVTSGYERRIAGEQAEAARVLTYVVDEGAAVRVPLEPDAEVVRVAAHAYRHGPLAPEPHPARLSVTIQGQRQVLTFDAPGTAIRAAAEDGNIHVGDPVALNVEVPRGARGEVTLALDSIEYADGLLVRVDERESLGLVDALRRRSALAEPRREHVARRAGAPDWLDLDSTERAALVASRWTAAIAESDRGSPAIAVTLRPPAALAGNGSDLSTRSEFDLRPDERASGLVRGPATIVARGESSAPLAVEVGDTEGPSRRLEGNGTVRFEAGDGQLVLFAVTTDAPQRIAIASDAPDQIDLGRAVAYYRATPDRPAIVTAGPEPLVVRVSARRPVARSLRDGVPLVVDASFEGGGHESPTSTFRATVERSIYDRYSPPSPELAPSERAIFYVLVPRHGRATLRPPEDSVDLSLSELDPMPSPGAGLAPSEGDSEGDRDLDASPAFSFRRPSNAQDFGLDDQGIVLVAPRPAKPVAPPSQDGKIGRVLRPRVAGTLRRDGRLFEPASVRFTVPAPRGEPLVLAARLFSDGSTRVATSLDGGVPRRRWGGIAQRITVPRTIPVDGEAKVAVVLGDDLEPGAHELAFVAASSAQVWVHLPWIRGAGAPAPRSLWLAGDFAP